MTAGHITMSWTNQGTSIRMDVISFFVALAIHAPLFFVTFEAKRTTFDRPAERLVSVDLIEPEAPRPVAPPAPKEEDTGFMARLKALVRKDPPPPPPKPVAKVEPKTIDLAPKEIKLDPKTDLPAPAQAKLKSRAGFETAADPKLVARKNIELKTLGAGIAPLTAKKVGVVEARDEAKRDRGAFQVAKAESLSSIGGSGPAISAPDAPVLKIRAGDGGTQEKFSAAAPQREDKGSFGGGAAPSLANASNLSLRDRIIARDAAPSQIGSPGGGPGGVAGGLPGGVAAGSLATKRDAGRFEARTAEVVGGAVGGVAGSAARARAAPAVIAKKPRQKREMFVITGPLKDRPVTKRVIPEYPSWAQSRGIEAAVVLQFTVVADGSVKNNIVVRRTSGYSRLDQSAIDALRKWIFEPLANENREEVGLITFNYTLS